MLKFHMNWIVSEWSVAWINIDFPQSNEYIYRLQHKSSTNKFKLSTTVNGMSIKRSSGIYYLKTPKQDSDDRNGTMIRVW